MSINNTTRKTAVMYGNGTSVLFPFAFRINDEEDLKVYVKIGENGQYEEKELNTDYKLSNLVRDTNNNIISGDIEFPIIIEGEPDQPSPLTENDSIYALRETPKTQEESSEQVSFKSKDMERALDKATMQIQELQEEVDRSYKAPSYQSAIDEADFYTVAENIDKVNTVASNIPAIETSNYNATAISTVANNISDVNAVGQNIEDVGTVALNLNDISTVADIASDVTQVAGVASAVQTVSNSNSEVLLVADNLANVNTVANSITDVQTVSNISNDVSSVADNATNINTVATNISNVNTAASNMAAIIAAPTAATNAANSALNAATSATNAQKWAEGTDSEVQPLGGTKSSKGWANRAQELVESIGTVMRYKGSVANYAALQAIQNPTLGDTYNVLDTGANYSWDGSAWDEIGSAVDLSAYRTSADQDLIDAGKVNNTGTETIAGVKTFSDGIVANVTGNLTGTASNATADANGDTISSTYIKVATKGVASGVASLDANTKVPVTQLPTMTGATGSVAGATGLVPAPTATDNTKFLKGDGTWATPTASGGTWGSITGDLEDQTDLQNELDSKAPAVLLSHFWSDHIINEMSYLRGDTFSWQSGDVYTAVYNHLVNDLTINVDTLYCWTRPSKEVYTTKENPSVGDNVYVITDGVVEFASTVNSISGDTLIPANMQAYHRYSDGDISNQTVPVTPQTETIGNYTITYYEADDKHKICLADQETILYNLFNEYGAAGYYILDTTNTRFKLPRDSSGHGQLIEKMNSDTDYCLVFEDGYCIQGGRIVSTANTRTTITFHKEFLNTNYDPKFTCLTYINDGYIMGFDNLTTTTMSVWNTMGQSPTIAWSAQGYVQAPANPYKEFKKYLYFYVGTFTKTAYQETAGLNSELFNGKADRDLSNVTGTSGFRKLISANKTGNAWYKVYAEYDPSTGTFLGNWCEQGDTVTRAGAAAQTITFPLPFADTSYTLIQNYQAGTANGNTGENENGYFNKTTTGFTKKSTVALTYITEFAYVAYGYI